MSRNNKVKKLVKKLIKNAQTIDIRKENVIYYYRFVIKIFYSKVKIKKRGINPN